MRSKPRLLQKIRSKVLRKGSSFEFSMGHPVRPRLDAQTLLDMSPAYVTVQDTAYRIVQANESFLRDFGDGIGRHCYEVYKGGDAVCEECSLERTLREGRKCTWEETLQTVHQETIHTVAHTAPIYGAGERISGALKISVDISEQKRLQKQLELSQREYKALFNGVPCYISVQDRDFKIIRTNRLFEKDFGRALGRRCHKVYKGREDKCPDCPVEKTFLDAQIHSSEEVVRLGNGRDAHMIVYTAPQYDLSGRVFAVMEMATNISEIKRLQRELTTVGEAVAVTAHAIKNILNGLKGGAYVVQSGLKREDPTLARQGWEMVSEGVDMVSRLVRDILTISKKRTPQYEQVDPNDLARQIWTLFDQRARDLGIPLGLELDPDAQHIALDPKGVHAALSNLVSNAMDACSNKEDGQDRRVYIRVRDSHEDGLSYEIEDTGTGIPPSVKQKLFNEVISTKGSTGTGLGLLATHKIVQEHGGEIEVDSHLQRGSRIRVRFPRNRPGAASPNPPRRNDTHDQDAQPRVS